MSNQEFLKVTIIKKSRSKTIWQVTYPDLINSYLELTGEHGELEALNELGKEDWKLGLQLKDQNIFYMQREQY